MIKIYPSWFIFMFLIVLGVLMIISSDNWFSWWIGFELSLLGFLPMFLASSSVIESMIKYFMIQAGGSSLFLLSFFFSNKISCYILLMSMVLKLGLFPLFFWVPLVMGGMSWTGCLMLVTIQKVGPLFITILISPSMMMFVFYFSLLSVFMGGVLGLGQSLMRGLMSYSSISHGGWMVLALIFDYKIGLMYIIIYFFLNYILFKICDYYNIIFLVKGVREGGFDLILVMLIILGFPPFSMFFLKVFIFMTCIELYSFVCFLLIISIYMYVYYYMLMLIPMVSIFFIKKNSFIGVMYTPGMLLLLYMYCLFN